MCTHTTSAAWLAELGKTYILMPKKEVSFIFAFVALAHFSCQVTLLFLFTGKAGQKKEVLKALFETVFGDIIFMEPKS